MHALRRAVDFAITLSEHHRIERLFYMTYPNLCVPVKITFPFVALSPL